MTSSPTEPPVLDPHEAGELEELLAQLAAAAAPAGYTVPGRHVDGRATTVDRTRLPWEAVAGGRELELVAQLRLTASRQSRMGGGGGGAPAPAGEHAGDHDVAVAVRVAPLPYVANASGVAEELHGFLAAWTARTMVADQRQAPIGPRRPGPRSLATGELAGWLLSRLPTLEQRPGSTREELDRLRRLVRRGRAIVDRPAERWYAGPCSTPLRDEAGDLVIVDGEQAYCLEDLYAKPHAWRVTCTACGAEHLVDDRRAELLKLARDRVERAIDVSRALTSLGQPVTPDRIRQWKARGRLVPHATDAEGAPLYRIGDVIDLLTADAVRRARRDTKETRTA